MKRMKKWLVTLLAGLMVFGCVGGALAQESVTGDIGESVLEEQTDVKGVKIKLVKEFQDEIHQVNALKVDYLEAHIQVVEKNDQILDLILQAKDSGNKDALKAAKEVHKQIKAVNEEIKSLRQHVDVEKKAFKEALKNGDQALAQQHIDNVITLKETINSKMEIKVQLLNKIIDILS